MTSTAARPDNTVSCTSGSEAGAARGARIHFPPGSRVRSTIGRHQFSDTAGHDTSDSHPRRSRPVRQRLGGPGGAVFVRCEQHPGVADHPYIRPPRPPRPARVPAPWGSAALYRVTTSGGTSVTVFHASLGQLQVGGSAVVIGRAGPDGTLSALGVVQPPTWPSGAHTSVSMRNCSPASINHAIMALGTG
jgi:hypothetical protein